MKGLMLKDYYQLREGLWLTLCVLAAIGAGIAFLVSPWALAIVAAATLSMQVGATISMDKAAQWDRYSATLPLSRRQVIGEKYALYALLCLAGLVLGLAAGGAAAWLQGRWAWRDLTLYASVALIVSLLPGSVNIPWAHLWGEEKGMAGLILSYMASSALVAGLVLVLKGWMDMQTLFPLLAGLSALAYLLSWRICPDRIARRDL